MISYFIKNSIIFTFNKYTLGQRVLYYLSLFLFGASSGNSSNILLQKNVLVLQCFLETKIYIYVL